MSAVAKRQFFGATLPVADTSSTAAPQKTSTPIDEPVANAGPTSSPYGVSSIVTYGDTASVYESIPTYNASASPENARYIGHSDTAKIGGIVGGVVGAVLLALGLFLFLFCRRRKRQAARGRAGDLSGSDDGSIEKGQGKRGDSGALISTLPRETSHGPLERERQVQKGSNTTKQRAKRESTSSNWTTCPSDASQGLSQSHPSKPKSELNTPSSKPKSSTNKPKPASASSPVSTTDAAQAPVKPTSSGEAPTPRPNPLFKTDVYKSGWSPNNPLPKP